MHCNLPALSDVPAADGLLSPRTAAIAACICSTAHDAASNLGVGPYFSDLTATLGFDEVFEKAIASFILFPDMEQEEEIGQPQGLVYILVPGRTRSFLEVMLWSLFAFLQPPTSSSIRSRSLSFGIVEFRIGRSLTSCSHVCLTPAHHYLCLLKPFCL